MLRFILPSEDMVLLPLRSLGSTPVPFVILKAWGWNLDAEFRFEVLRRWVAFDRYLWVERASEDWFGISDISATASRKFFYLPLK
jgi:hypothetical protein